MPKENPAAQLLSDISPEQAVAQLAAFIKLSRSIHHYSIRNLFLIFMQCPHASYVAGYRKWPDLGRHVKRGEQGIAILAPHTWIQDAGTVDEHTAVGFHTTYVFDISQTDGDDIEQLLNPPGSADPDYQPGNTSLLTRNALAMAFSVAHENGYQIFMEPGSCPKSEAILGQCNLLEKTLRFFQWPAPEDDLTLRQIDTLFHETTHILVSTLPILNKVTDQWQQRCLNEVITMLVTTQLMAAHGYPLIRENQDYMDYFTHGLPVSINEILTNADLIYKVLIKRCVLEEEKVAA